MSEEIIHVEILTARSRIPGAWLMSIKSQLSVKDNTAFIYRNISMITAGQHIERQGLVKEWREERISSSSYDLTAAMDG